MQQACTAYQRKALVETVLKGTGTPMLLHWTSQEKGLDPSPQKKTRFVDCFQNWKINQMNRERVEVLEKLYQQIVMEAQETQFTLAPHLD